MGCSDRYSLALLTGALAHLSAGLNGYPLHPSLQSLQALLSLLSLIKSPLQLRESFMTLRQKKSFSKHCTWSLELFLCFLAPRTSLLPQAEHDPSLVTTLCVQGRANSTGMLVLEKILTGGSPLSSGLSTWPFCPIYPGRDWNFFSWLPWHPRSLPGT